MNERESTKSLVRQKKKEKKKNPMDYVMSLN